MRPSSVVLLVALVALASCRGPKPGSVCGKARCELGQVCDPITLLCVANAPPEISVSSPVSGELLAGMQVKLRGQVSDDEDNVEVLEVSTDGANWAEISRGPGGAFEYTLALPSVDAVALPIQFRAKDPWEAVGTAQVDVSVDNIEPACAPLRPVPDGTLGLVSGGVPIEFSVSDGSGQVTAEISVDNGSNFEPASFADGKASRTWRAPSGINGEELVLVLRATDPSGNGCEVKVHAYLDTSPPMVTISTPRTGALVGPATLTALHAEGIAADLSRTLDRVELSLGDGQAPTLATLSGNTWTADILLGADDYVARTLTATAIDRGGNATTATVAVTIDRVAPVISFSSPAEGQKFNLADLNGTDLVSVAYSFADGDASAQRWTSVDGTSNWTSGGPASVSIQTQGSDNGAQHSLSVKAVDTAGNESLQTRTFLVDRVPPAFTMYSPTTGRNQPARVRMVFSEPVAPAATPLAMTVTPSPTNPGAMGSGDTEYVQPLANDTVYSVTLATGAFIDRFGNPTGPVASSNFHTEVATPSSGAVLLSGVGEVRAAADEDGAVTFMALDGAPGGRFIYGKIDPSTGVPVTLSSVGQGEEILRFQPSAARRLQGLSAVRITGAMTKRKPVPPFNLSTDVGQWTSNDGASETKGPGARAVIPTEAGCAEGDGLGQAAIVMGNSYERAGASVPLTLAFQPTHSTYADRNHWTVWNVAPPNLEEQSFDCSCTVLEWSCMLTPSTVMRSNLSTDSISIAETGRNRVLVYHSGSGLMEYCSTIPERYACPALCTRPSTETPASPGLRVAPKHDNRTIIGAYSVATGVQLAQRDILDCAGSWVDFGAPLVEAGISSFDPVMIGTRPGLLYTAGGDVKVYIP